MISGLSSLLRLASKRFSNAYYNKAFSDIKPLSEGGNGTIVSPALGGGGVSVNPSLGSNSEWVLFDPETNEPIKDLRDQTVTNPIVDITPNNALDEYAYFDMETFEPIVDINPNNQETDTAYTSNNSGAAGGTYQTSTKANELIQNLYGKSVSDLIAAQDNIINSTTFATIDGASAYAEKMGKDDYSKGYASKATFDFAEKFWGADTLSALGVERSASSIYDNPNRLDIDDDHKPKIGDIVITGNDDGTNKHSGVVVAITDDGKYIVQEANSDKANGGGAMVAYTLDAADGHTKNIQGFIPVNDSVAEANKDESDIPALTPDSVSITPANTEADNEDETETTQSISLLTDNAQVNYTKNPVELVKSLYGDSVENLVANSSATTAKPKIASIDGIDAFGDAMGTEYSGAYASKATYDFLKQVWGEDALEAVGLKRDYKTFYNNANRKQIDDTNKPKVGDVVITGEGGDKNPHNGVVVAITSDGRYIVQEANSAKASQGGALVIYGTSATDDQPKYIKSFISITPAETSGSVYQDDFLTIKGANND